MRLSVLSLSIALCMLGVAPVAAAAEGEDSGTSEGSDDGSDGGSDEGSDDGSDEGEEEDTAEDVDDGVYGGHGAAQEAGEKGGWGCDSSAGAALLFGMFGWVGLSARRRDGVA